MAHIKGATKNYNSLSLVDKKALLYSEYGINVEGHTQKLTKISVTDDQMYLISGDDSGVIKKWNIANGDYEGSFIGHTSVIIGLIVFNDHLITAEASLKSHIFIWDIRTMKKVDVISKEPISVVLMKLEKKTQTLVYISNFGRILNAYSLNNNSLSYQIKYKLATRPFSFNSITNMLYTITKSKIIGYDTVSGIKLEKLKFKSDYFRNMEISPDGQSMILCGRNLELWYKISEQETSQSKTFPYKQSWSIVTSEIIDTSYTKDSKYILIICKDKSLRVVDIKYHKVHNLYESLVSIPQCLCVVDNHIINDQNSISVVLGYDKFFYIYNFLYKDYFINYCDVGCYNSIVILPGKKILIGITRIYDLEICNLEENNKISGFEIKVVCLLSSSKKVYFIFYVGGGYMAVGVDFSTFSSCIITPENFSSFFTYDKCTEILQNTNFNYYIFKALISASDTELALFGTSPNSTISVQIFDLIHGKLLKEVIIPGSCNYLSVTIKNKSFVYAYKDSSKFYIHEFGYKDSRSYTEFNSFITCLNVDIIEENLIIGTNYGLTYIWNFKSKRLIRSINGNNLGVESIYCGIDNFYGINYNDKSLGIIIFMQAIKRNILKVHNGNVNGIHITNDTKTAYSLGNDRCIKIWNLRTGELMNTIRTKYHLTSINFTLDERFAMIFSKELYFVVYDLNGIKDILNAKYEKKTYTSFEITKSSNLCLIVNEKKTLYIYKIRHENNMNLS